VSKLIKIFAVLLIAVAIPVQGFASVAMMNCEQSPNHHSKNLAIDTVHDHDQHTGHDMSNEHSHDASDSSNPVSQNADKSKHSCAYCAKCTSSCAGFTFQTTTSSLIQQLNAGEIRYGYNSLLFTGFIPSGLERPPRYTLI